MATVEELVRGARRALAAAPFRPSSREAVLLMGHVLGLREAQVLARSRDELAAAEVARFRRLLARRLAGEPVAYLTGEKEFWGRPFRVDRRVLVPRPETEHLIEAALGADLPAAPRILELGTGSGCIAVTLACELAGARVVATDLSPAALAVAAHNARRHGVRDRVALVAADLARGLDPARFHLVVSNPPYLAREEAASLSPEVREFEPDAALFAPQAGLGIVARALHELAGVPPGSPLILEIGRGQAEQLRELASHGPFAVESIVPDYAGIPRVAIVRRAGPTGPTG